MSSEAWVFYVIAMVEAIALGLALVVLWHRRVGG